MNLESLTVEAVKKPSLQVMLAEGKEQVEQAQKLRYQIFFEEMGGVPHGEVAEQKRDFDEFDEYCEHLIVVDNNTDTSFPRIVGTYRLLHAEKAKILGKFYTQGEFDISNIIAGYENILEVGRSCVHRDYRNKPVIQLLWRGLAEYITSNNIEIILGCASFPGTDSDKLKNSLSYLYHYHLVPAELKAKALDGLYINMNLVPKEEIDAKKSYADLPPLIKGYLRLGGYIGDGAVPDYNCNTIDVLTIVRTDKVSDKYRNYFLRNEN